MEEEIYERGIPFETLEKWKVRKVKKVTNELEEEMSKGKQKLWIHRNPKWGLKPRRFR